MIPRKQPKLLDGFLSEALDGDLADALDLLAAPALDVEAVPPASDLRARMLAATHSTHRFDDFEERIAALADISVEESRRLLLAVDAEDTSWESSMPGIRLLHFEGGPAVRPAITGFVRVAAGATFPHHEHVGDEVSLILQGSCTTSDGTTYRAGDEIPMPQGTAHSFTVTGPNELMFLAVVRTGITIDGEFIGPEDPRA